MAASMSETGTQLLARLGPKPSLKLLEPKLLPAGASSHDVIEFYGEEGTGKTQMLLHLISQCILPDEWRGVSIEGLSVSVIFIDTDFHLNMIRLVGILETRIRSALDKYNTHVDGDIGDGSHKIDATEEAIEALLKSCLSKLYVVRCYSCSNLIITLHSLDTILGNNPDISVLMLDSVSSFYWIDKSNGGDNLNAQQTNMNKVVDILKKLLSTYKLVLFATKAALFQKRQRDTSPHSRPGSSLRSVQTGDTEHCEYLCKRWQHIITHRWIFSRRKQPGISICEEGVDSRGCFSVTFDGPSQAVAKGAKLQFRIGESGITFLPNLKRQ